MRSGVLSLKRARKLRREMTRPEVAPWTKLRGRSPDRPRFRRQHPIGPYILDFYHRRRDAWLREQGLTVYRVSAGAVMRDSDEVADGVFLLARELSGQK